MILVMFQCKSSGCPNWRLLNNLDHPDMFSLMVAQLCEHCRYGQFQITNIKDTKTGEEICYSSKDS